uniref:Polycystic kidney disease 1a n=1 Tax=Tetraodon nigroviridis TaxID=99883 RepID=H3BXX9_TETNG
LHSVKIHTEKRAYPTNAEVTFLAVSKDQLHPLDFLWDFGDSSSTRTTSGRITKKYTKPGRYDVVLVASRGGSRVAADVLSLVVQSAVRLNRLQHQASVLLNHTVTVNCRVSAGTEVSFLWDFGDGSSRPGQSTEQHVFQMTGEFRVTVTVFNLVSSASLSSHIFVVTRPCRPPAVKNMGPSNIQVRRHEVVRVGVTYEQEVDCGSGGLGYSWTLWDSAGGVFPLPGIHTHRQTLTLPSFLLDYDTYTAVARVQVADSVVYSNYSVRVQVIPSPPVASVQGGTNIFMSRNAVASLDGRESYDPDFPTNPLRFRWTCEPVSSLSSSCFRTDVPMSSPVLVIPAGGLKPNFDQFRFVLTVHSSNRSASSEVFITLTSNVIGKASVLCSQCRGDRINWDQPFTVSASCEGCDLGPGHVEYSWSLYLVDASSKPAPEGPLCQTADLRSPSAVVQAPVTSTFHPPSQSAAARSGVSGIQSPLPTGSSLSRPLRAMGWMVDQVRIKAETGPKDTVQSCGRSEAECVCLVLVPGVLPSMNASLDDVDFNVHLSPEEGEPGVSAGRPTGTSQRREESQPDLEEPVDEGSNLVDSRPAVLIREPLLLDLPRELVEARLFDSYTYTGLSSPQLSFRAFSLEQGSRYMLEVIARSAGVLGRTQLFLKTNPAPTGVTCQVRPAQGFELVTHFSIFCTSGKKDLTYKYSLRVGDGPPRTLYRGTDYQYYFSLPSGDPSDDYRVTVSTEVRSSLDRTVSKACSSSVRVLPSFSREASSSHFHPDPQLLESGLRNLSALLRLGNGAEVRNSISLLGGALNRLSWDDGGSTRAQRRARNALICTVCQLESGDQESAEDSVGILGNLLRVTNQVTLMSVRRVSTHVQTMSQWFRESASSGRFGLDPKTLEALVALLSRSLQASLTGRHFETYMLFHGVREHRVHSDLMVVHAMRRNHTPAVVGGDSAAFYLPDSLFSLLPVQAQSGPGERCVLAVLTELARSPFTWARRHPRLDGPVVDLDLYQCGMRRKIPSRSLVVPVTVQLRPPPQPTHVGNSFLFSNLQRQVGYHGFNVTQQHLRRAIQVTVHFRRPPNKAFPITLLFRMFERPTPSMHHLSRTHRWEGDAVVLTLPPSFLSTAGVAYVALLDAEFAKASGRRHVSAHVSYSLRVDSRACLSWDAQRASWTPSGCRTLQTDATAAVNCSCDRLRPTTVAQQQMGCSYDSADLDLFLSVPSNPTVLCVLLLCVCLYIPAWVACRRADAIAKENRKIHHLSDNSPHDRHLYAVSVRTGPRSALRMSAKVYIVLYGEDGVSQTKELQVPGCTLFRRNSQDTFILSSAERLGPVWGVRVWHDNSGSSPSWYLNQVEVCEERSWLFVAQRWLAVDKDDGRVERTLRARTPGRSFSEMLRLKLSDYLADYHIWMSLLSCPHPNPFTHTQRVCVSLLLLLTHAAVNAAIVSQTDDPALFRAGVMDGSALSVKIGAVGALLALPAAAAVSFVFRGRQIELTGSDARRRRGSSGEETPTHTSGIPPLHQHSDPLSSLFPSLSEEFSVARVWQVLERSRGGEEGNDSGAQRAPGSALKAEEDEEKEPGVKQMRRIQGRRGLLPPSLWRGYLAWTLCVSLSSCCLVYSAALGNKMSSGQVLLWIHSLFFSLTSCFFLLQPALITAAAVAVSLFGKGNYQESSGLRRSSTKDQLDLSDSSRPEAWSCFPTDGSSYLDKRQLLRARQRLRYLRLLRPPTPAQLRKSREERRRDALLLKTIKDLFFCGSTLFLMVCINLNGSFTDQHRLRNAITKQFIGRGRDDTFLSVQTHEDWWTWVQSSLHLLYKNASVPPEVGCRTQKLGVMIGEPIVWKMEESSSYNQAPGVTAVLERIHSSLSGSRTWAVPGSTKSSAETCAGPDCDVGPNATVSLGCTKSDALSRLKSLRSGGWLDRRLSAVKLQFTLFSPAPNLFTSVTLLAVQRPTGVLQPSAKVHTVRVYRTPALWDYVAMVLQLLNIVCSLLQLRDQVHALGQQGIMGYWRAPRNWMDVALLTATLVYHLYYLYRSVLILEVVELLQERRGHVDVSLLATCEQHVRSLCGVTLFLLLLKSAAALRVFRPTLTPAALLT